MALSRSVKWGIAWSVGKVLFRYAYIEYKGKKYRRLYKKVGKRGAWIAVGAAAVFLAATWAPAGGFSWLFRMSMR